jgi:hypothetical protein
MNIQFYHYSMTLARLAPMRACIWQFTVLFLKFTKPAYEHHLQAFKAASQACFSCPACPNRSLHMAIHGFAFWKFAKPAHEHHLQALKAASQAYSCANMTYQF